MGKKNKNSGEALKKKQDKKAKQEEKAARKAKKKGKKKNDVEDEEDIDELIKAILKQDQAKDAPAVIEEVEQPCPRSSCSMVLVPGSGSATALPEVLILGGELFDNNTNQCFGNLYRYNAAKNVWKSLIFDNGKGGPPARCSHQACVVRNHMYVFGGEFATAWQFYHYRDFWRFDLDTNKWEAMNTKDGPPPRSGHRIAHWKHFLILFGGFYEASRGVKWYNDLFFFNLRTLKWKQQLFPPHVQQPSPRSGVTFVTHPNRDSVYCYGGYAKVTVSATVQRGRQFSDMWRLDLDMAKGDGTWPAASWELVPNRGRGPSPRSGVASAVHKNRIIVFGGVTDNETSNDVEGEFHNSLYAFDMDRSRWFELNLREHVENGKKKKKKTRKKKSKVDESQQGEEESAEEAESSESDAEDDDNLGLNDNSFYFIIDGKMVEIVDDGADEDEENAENVEMQVEDSSTMDVPDDSPMEAPVTSEEVSEIEAQNIPTEKSPLDAGNTGDAKTVEECDGEETKMVTPEEHEKALMAQATQTVDEMVPEVEAMDISHNAEAQQEDDQDTKQEEPDKSRKPEPRIGANMVVSGNKMLLFGGTTEVGNKQITFDDMWMLDLNQMQEWQEIISGTWRDLEWGDAEEEEDESDEEEGSDEEMDGQGEDEEDQEMGGRFERNKLGVSSKIQELRTKLGVEAEESTPQPGESLREFFVRTVDHWLQLVAQDLDRKAKRWVENHPGVTPPQSRHQGKDLRRMAFHKANDRFEDLYPLLQELNELEREQREAEERAQKYAEAQAKKAAAKKQKKRKN